MSRVQEFDFNVDLLRAILWQYDQADRLVGLLQAEQDWYNENYTAFWQNWVVDVFDLRTANDFGLAVWAIILDLPLYSEIEPSPPDYPAFGFGDYGLNFGNGNFATDAPSAASLTTEQKRLILRLRYFQLTTRGAIPEINQFLSELFGPGEVYLLDGLDMQIAYVFTTPLPSAVSYVLQQFDILPRPAGVGVEIRQANLPAFGFAPYGLNFDNGSFLGGLS